ncbi:MAG: hypothetical protein OS112_01550 [Methanoregula sp.]|nr:MAG: hypothetical protein OS112_01550 [Methanoregula sp.]
MIASVLLDRSHVKKYDPRLMIVSGVESQYYTTSEVTAVFEDTLAKQVPRFLVKYQGVVDRLDTKKVRKIKDTYLELTKRNE